MKQLTARLNNYLSSQRTRMQKKYGEQCDQLKEKYNNILYTYINTFFLIVSLSSSFQQSIAFIYVLWRATVVQEIEMRWFFERFIVKYCNKRAIGRIVLQTLLCFNYET